MKLSLSLVIGGLLAAFGGAYLIGWWAVGVLLLVAGVAAVIGGVLLDDGEGRQPQAAHVRAARSEKESLDRMFERQRFTP